MCNYSATSSWILYCGCILPTCKMEHGCPPCVLFSIWPTSILSPFVFKTLILFVCGYHVVLKRRCPPVAICNPSRKQRQEKGGSAGDWQGRRSRRGLNKWSRMKSTRRRTQMGKPGDRCMRDACGSGGARGSVCRRAHHLQPTDSSRGAERTHTARSRTRTHIRQRTS